MAGHMAAEILNGKKPGEIDAVIAYQKLPTFVVVVNKGSAELMGIKIPDAVLSRATRVVN